MNVRVFVLTTVVQVDYLIWLPAKLFKILLEMSLRQNCFVPTLAFIYNWSNMYSGITAPFLTWLQQIFQTFWSRCVYQVPFKAVLYCCQEDLVKSVEAQIQCLIRWLAPMSLVAQQDILSWLALRVWFRCQPDQDIGKQSLKANFTDHLLRADLG